MTPNTSPNPAPNPTISPLARDLTAWFAVHARPLPWRHPDTTIWAILVSEVMAQQTPVARVAPLWQAWLERWPTPADLAEASAADVLLMWANLGYPRRALRLQECARAIVAHHAGVVPRSIAELEALPGIGSYTARAVACFADNQAVAVVDTNVRRVLYRLIKGRKLQGPARRADLAEVAALLPVRDPDPALPSTSPITDAGSAPSTSPTSDSPASDTTAHDTAVLMSAALMELGAVICTARSPQCGTCPVSQHCAWLAAGQPEPTESEQQAAASRVQTFAGTDRQCRGTVMAAARAAFGTDSPTVTWEQLAPTWPDEDQLRRAIAGLVADGLLRAVLNDTHSWSLPH